MISLPCPTIEEDSVYNDDYISIVTSMLVREQHTFREVSSKQTHCVQNKINKNFKCLKKGNSDSDDQYKHLRSATASTLPFYIRFDRLLKSTTL